jgi:hypothetical protein
MGIRNDAGRRGLDILNQRNVSDNNNKIMVTLQHLLQLTRVAVAIKILVLKFHTKIKEKLLNWTFSLFLGPESIKRGGERARNFFLSPLFLLPVNA